MTEAGETVDEAEWLSAAEALRRVCQVMTEFQARHAIADRAKDGLVRTWALRFVKHRETLDDVELPKEFWWAGAHEALEQNWVAGDFSTWINRTWHWKSYGVRFLETDIAKLIPHQPVEASSPAFIPSAEALKQVSDVLGDESAASAMLFEWLKCGELPAKARTYRRSVEDGPVVTEQDKTLGAEEWEQFEEVSVSAFKSGIAVTTGWDSWVRSTVTTRVTGIRFSALDLAALVQSIPADVSARSTPAASGTGRGRPRADWWDDLWAEMCRQLYTGDLQPKKQSDIENAMHDWLAKRGESAATSTVRARARKLWMVIDVEDEN